jgi:hypothetical protein
MVLKKMYLGISGGFMGNKEDKIKWFAGIIGFLGIFMYIIRLVLKFNVSGGHDDIVDATNTDNQLADQQNDLLDQSNDLQDDIDDLNDDLNEPNTDLDWHLKD